MAQREHAFDVFLVLCFDVFVVLCFDVFLCTFDVSVRSGGGQAGCGTKRTRF